jgi:hypothetical protein
MMRKNYRMKKKKHKNVSVSRLLVHINMDNRRRIEKRKLGQLI